MPRELGGRFARLAFLFPVALPCLLPRAARADGVNIEKERPDKPGVAGAVDLKFGYRQGNVNLVDVGLRTRVSFLRGRHLVFGLTDSRFAAQSKTRDGGDIRSLSGERARFANRHMVHGRYNLRMFDWMASESFSQLEADEFLVVRTRVLVGAGPRFILFERADFGAYLGTTYMAEREDLDPRAFVSQPGGEGRTNWWHRWSNYLSLRFLATDRLTLSSTTYFQPRFDAFGDFRVLNDNGLEVELVSRLSLKWTFSIRHDSRPPTACAEPEGTSCPAEATYTLAPTDLFAENALSLKF